MIASISIIVFALPTTTDSQQRKLDAAALFWAVLTAVGIAFYSVVDASVARKMPETMTFVVWLFLLDWIGITAVMLYTRRGKVWASVRPQLKNGVFGGFVGAISYGAAIFAFTMMGYGNRHCLARDICCFRCITRLHIPEGRLWRKTDCSSVNSRRRARAHAGQSLARTNSFYSQSSA